MKKKIILFGLMLVMGFVLGLINVQAVLVPPCGLSLPPPWCSTVINCGAKKCTAVYEAIDAPASATCHTDFDILCMITQPEGFCGPYDPFFVCEGVTAKGAHCEPSTCIKICQTGAAYVYKGIEATAESTATTFYTGLIAAGVFAADIVPCGEIDSCMGEVPVSALQSYNRLTCEGIKQSTLVRVIGDPAVNKALLEQVLPEIATRPEVLEALKSTVYKFASPDQLASVITKCGSTCGDIFTKIVDQQSWSVLANQAVDAARVAAKIELSSINEMGVTALKLYNNLYQKFQPLIDLYNHPLVRLASVAHGAYSIVSSAFGGSGGGKDQLAAKTAAAATASQEIQNVQNSNPVGTTKIITCPNAARLSYNAAKCPGQPNCVYDTKDQSSQCLSALPPGGNAEVRFGSIHIMDKKLNNMFSLTGSQNEGVVYQDDGFVNVDDGGTTKISVAGDGAAVADHKDHELYIGKGTTYYFGNGNENADLFLTDSYLVSDEAKIAIDSINKIEQNKYQPKGNFREKVELAITLDGYSLKPYKNAVDVAKIDESFQVLTRGFSDILLLEQEKVFPFVTRNYAKGDASVIMHRNVKIPNTYIVNDETYEYTIKTIGDSTKVIAKNGKIIEDSGSFDTKLSRRQNILVNNI